MKNNWQERRSPEYIAKESRDVTKFVNDQAAANQASGRSAAMEKHKINLRLADFSDNQLIELAKSSSKGTRLELENKLSELWQQRENILSRNLGHKIDLPSKTFFEALAILETLPNSKIPIEEIEKLHQEIKIIDAEVDYNGKRLIDLGAQLNQTSEPEQRNKLSQIMAQVRQQTQRLHRTKFDLENKLKSI